MEHSLKTKILASLGLLAISTCWTGTSVFAAYDPATNTETLTNRMISTTRDTMEGDMHTYDHGDRNLVINWNAQNGRGDGSAIRDASVNAKNLTINADFFDPGQWENKGIISDGEESGDSHVTHVTASGNINITTYNDAVYTETTGSTIIDGFKNLTIKSTGIGVDADGTPVGGYGLVDNGGGITVKGGADSTVDISTALYPAIGNTLNSITGDSEYAIGTGISIEAEKKITLSSPSAAVFSGINKNNNFQTTLNAPEIELNGSIYVGGGSVSIDDNQPGNITIHASQDDSLTEGYSIYSSAFIPNSSDAEPNSTVISINKNQGGRVQLDGGISNTGFSTVVINMTGNNSFITTVGEKDKELGYVKKKCCLHPV